jgi:tRNA1(Val) A37 N6-methylase TrmN6
MKSLRSPDVKLLPGESIDEFMDGRLKLIQSRTGYRFSIDAILLSQFVTIRRGDRVVDLGTGCGIIPLVLLLTRPVAYAVGLDEMLTSLDDILNAASRMLRAKGRLAMIYPAVRLVDVLVKMRGFNLEPKSVRIVYPGMESEAKLALIEAALGGRRGLKLLPPLFDQGDFSI